MPDPEIVHFKVNPRLKSILGRDLIYNPNVAIIELIKNSKDASSSVAEVIFSNASTINADSSLIIQDYGSGMTKADILEKWLNIAYSGKSGEKVKGKFFAGQKGIGRFSCDSLGEILELYTRAVNGNYIKLVIDWKKFETPNVGDVISSIEIEMEEIIPEVFTKNTGFSIFEHGTLLVIKRLRSIWDEKSLVQLKKDLGRVLATPDKSFEIRLTSNDLLTDKDELLFYKEPIRNNVFTEISYRSTMIKAQVKDNSLIFTLYHSGNMVFSSTEINPYNTLQDVEIIVTYLNAPAKKYFKESIAGMESVNYGSIFLFLNDFRVYPYGEFGDDWLSLETRKSQGTRRYLGTRDIIGAIYIRDRERAFVPVSSREGLAHNKAYKELTSFDKENTLMGTDGSMHFGLMYKVIRKLEKFIVDGINWDKPVGIKHYSEIDLKTVKFEDRDKEIVDILDSVINIQSSKHAEVNVNYEYIYELSKRNSEEYKKIIENIKGKNYGDLSGKDKAIKDLHEKLENEKRHNEKLKEEGQRKKREVEDISAENLFLRSDKNQDKDDLKNLHHQILGQTSTITKAIINFRKNASKYKLSDSDKKGLHEFLGKIDTLNQRIIQYSSFATTGNYKLAANKKFSEFTSFVSLYLDRLKQLKIHDNNIEIVNSLNTKIKHELHLQPLALTIFIDNLISNAIKASANIITFENSDNVWLKISNDGNSLDDAFKDDPERLFMKGATTTDGSGLGLYYAKDTLVKLGLKIQYVDSGQFTLEVVK